MQASTPHYYCFVPSVKHTQQISDKSPKKYKDFANYPLAHPTRTSCPQDQTCNVQCLVGRWMWHARTWSWDLGSAIIGRAAARWFDTTQSGMKNLEYPIRILGIIFQRFSN